MDRPPLISISRLSHVIEEGVELLGELRVLHIAYSSIWFVGGVTYLCFAFMNAALKSRIVEKLSILPVRKQVLAGDTDEQ